MKLRFATPLVALLLCISAQAWGEPIAPPAPPPPAFVEDEVEAPRPANPQIDSEGLRKILEGLGYEPKKLKSGDAIAWQIELEHAGGDARTHLIGFDPKAATVFIIGGGFSFAPDPKKASNEWFRRLLKANHQLAPSYIFLNDFDVFGLTTVLGNVGITPARMKTKLKEHVTNFDEKLVPLVKELPPIQKKEEEDKATGANGGGVAR